MVGSLHALRTVRDLLDELDRLRVTAAGGRGKVRLSLHDLATATGIPKSSLANYLSGRTAMPADLLDKVLLALGVGVSRAREWSEAWERVTAERGRAVPPGRCTLPRDAETFTGREREVAAVVGAMTTSAATRPVAVYAIDGLPGAGKTALAVHIAHRLAARFPDRRLFVDLHAHTAGRDPVDPMDALATLLAADGIATLNLPAALDDRAALFRARMAGKRTLLVLDNALGSDQVRPLLPGTAGCLVLVTSRRRLADLGAVPVPLGTLPPGEAAEMFGRLAPRGRDEPEAAARLVELCGGLPLAISLLASAYAKHPAWRVDDLIGETRARLASARAESRIVAAAFDLSYRGLPPHLRRLLRRLGAYPGPDIDPYAAAALDGTTPDEATARLDELCHDHLLTEPAHRRFRMHDLLREYARTVAAGPDTEEAVARAHAYLSRAAAEADRRIARHHRPPAAPPPPGIPPLPPLDGWEQALAWLRAERQNLVALLRHAERTDRPERVVALAAGLATVLRLDGPLRESRALGDAAVAAACRLGDPRAEAGALVERALTEHMLDDYAAAHVTLTAALDRYVAAADRLGEANARLCLSQVANAVGDHRGALELAGTALAAYRAGGERVGAATALGIAGATHRLLGEHAPAGEALDEALRSFRQLGHRLGEACALTQLGRLRDETGDLAGAADVLRRGLALARRDGGILNESALLHTLGPVLHRQGDLAGAAEVLGRSLRLCRELRDDPGVGAALNSLAGIRCRTGDLPGAHDLLAEALPLWRRIGDRAGETEALNLLGAVHRLDGDPRTGSGFHRLALRLARGTHSRACEAHSLAGLGRCAVAGGDPAEGAALLGRALDTFREIGAGEADAIAVELGSVSAGS